MPNWLVFVDTNIFLDFYRLGGESAERQIRSLERHQNSLIISEQLRVEFLKNRQKVILDNKIVPPKKIAVPPILADFPSVAKLVASEEELIRH
jgi:predicted nucleic acid-binding protein